MTQVQLPAHLQGRQVRSLTDRASEGMGGALPPHVSIQGNMFTFVDAAGNEMQPMPMFSAVIVDIADRMNKRYYDKPYEPGSDEPPRCWSANGLTPSSEVASPIHPTCEGCPANIRGSAVSRISGAAIKACRDEKWIAFIVPQLPQVVFRFVITPGSFQNWKAYTETLKGHGIELSFAMTQFSFAPKETGVLQFQHVGWIDEPTLAAVEAVVREGKTDALVGRSDPVRQPVLAASVQAGLAPPTDLGTRMAGPAQVGMVGASAMEVPNATVPQALSGAPAAPMAPPATFPAVAGPAAPAAEAPTRRRRRTAAEAAPATATAPPMAMTAPFGQPAQPASAAAPQASFGQPAAPATAPAGQFGIGGAAPVNAEMAAMLQQMGFQRAG